MFVPSKNRLARNIQVLQAFFLQNLALNLVATYLANLALKMKLFLQDFLLLARKASFSVQDLQDMCKN